jgi:hypothetical protein
MVRLHRIGIDLDQCKLRQVLGSLFRRGLPAKVLYRESGQVQAEPTVQVYCPDLKNDALAIFAK